MIYTKSDAGVQAMKDRHAVDLTRAQRSALILFDGQRSVRAVLEATAALGVTAADIDALASRGLLRRADGGREASDADAPTAPAALDNGAPAPAASAAPAAPTAPQALGEAERARRYNRAYPLATQLTAQLGLRGFTLNLAVESARGFDGLMALLPKLRAAVGDERLRPLEDALEGR